MSDLTDLGLSSYEEQCYRALLRIAPATASDVAEASDVPRGRIYDVLNGLAARDLVTVRAASEPRRYVPVDPDVAVDRLLAERREELRVERERYERLAEAVSTTLAATTPSECRFWPVALGSEDATAAMREQFDAADESLLSVVGAPYEEAPLDRYRTEVDAYLDLVEAGIEVKLLATPAVMAKAPSDDLREALAAAPTFDVRTVPQVGLTFDVLDGESVYVSLPTPFAAGERLGGIVVRDERLAADLADRFREVWERADPVEQEATASE